MAFLQKFKQQVSKQQEPQYKGVIPPLSYDEPTPTDTRNSQALLSWLSKYKLSDSPEILQLRQEVLGVINRLVQQWVYDECILQGIPPLEAKTYRAELLSFGSFRLGVNSENGDIDLLLVAPSIITRESFFNKLRKRIETYPTVNNFNAVPGAFVPIMTFTISNIEVDLIFGNVATRKLPTPFDINDNTYLLHIDKKDVKSLNGSRVTDKILSLVPNQSTFRTVLRFIKCWAKKRGIYSNVMGYLGGVSWAILTVQVCQLFPNAAPSTVLRAFFMVFKSWEWPKPVKLCPIEKEAHLYVQSPGLDRVWEPHPGHIFPILTPAFPVMNSTYNVQYVTKAILQSEFERGLDICTKLQNTTNEDDATLIYDKLIEDPLFYDIYNHYIDITISTTTEGEMGIWFGWVESKIRLFFNLLEELHRGHTPTLFTLRPWPFPACKDGGIEKHFYIAITFHVPPQEVQSKLSLALPTSKFTTIVNSFPSKTDNMSVNVSHIRGNQLPVWLWPNGINPRLRKKRKAPEQIQRITDDKQNSNDIVPSTSHNNPVAGEENAQQKETASKTSTEPQAVDIGSNSNAPAVVSEQ